MNTQPVFTLLHLLLNTPDLHTTHHSRGNAADLRIQKDKPLHHKTVLKQPREGKGGGERRRAVGAGASRARMCERARKSPSVTAVIIFLETTETVCCTGSLPSDNSNLQKYFVWAPLPAVRSHQ